MFPEKERDKASEEFKLILEAHNVLSNPKARAIYDQGLVLNIEAPKEDQGPTESWERELHSAFFRVLEQAKTNKWSMQTEKLAD